MAFTFNALNGSPKSNATAACSTNSPSKSNLNTDDVVKKTAEKSHLDTECIASESEPESNKSSLFVFGNHSQKRNSDLKTSEGFNFVFNSNCFDPKGSSNLNTESKVVNLSSVNFSINNNLFDDKEKMETKIDLKTELDSDNNNGNLNENSDENSVKDEQFNNQDQRQDENDSNEEMMIVRTVVKEFKDVISSFVKERIESEKKIALIEDRITTLEKEMQNLKSTDLKESSMSNLTNNNSNGTSKLPANSASLQSLEQLPLPVTCLTPSPLIPSPSESTNLVRKSAFGSSSSLFGASSAPFLNSTSTNSFGSAASSLVGKDGITSSNFVLGTSVFNSSTSTQNQGSNQFLFGSSLQTSNQNGKSLAPERKKANSQKLFTHEAVTNFLNAQKEPGMNNLTKGNTGNPFKKMANEQEHLEENQNMTTKESFESHLQRTIEMSVKKVLQEYSEHFKSNTSEDNFKKLNSGNMF